MKPQYFAGIGAAKCGTSWLADYLSGHPQVAFSPIKELHFFDAMYLGEPFAKWNDKWSRILSELSDKYRRSPSPEIAEKIRCVRLRLEMVDDATVYREYFQALITDDKPVFGELTPAYSLLPKEGFRAILELYPEAKFFFIMRDPADRYLSQVRFSRRLRAMRGGSPTKPFDPDLQALRHLRNPAYVERGNYRRTVETLQEVVEADRLCTLFYENLFQGNAPDEELSRLCRFLEIDFLPADVKRTVNESEEMYFDPSVVEQVRNHFQPTYAWVREFYRNALPEAWQR